MGSAVTLPRRRSARRQSDLLAEPDGKQDPERHQDLFAERYSVGDNLERPQSYYNFEPDVDASAYAIAGSFGVWHLVRVSDGRRDALAKPQPNFDAERHDRPYTHGDFKPVADSVRGSHFFAVEDSLIDRIPAAICNRQYRNGHFSCSRRRGA